jgi:hypothetical protein
MRRDQLEHAIRTACQIIGHEAVVVVGSQSILGSFAENELPVEATMSTEIEILPLGKDDADTARLADVIEGVAGEWSPFEEQHGFRTRASAPINNRRCRSSRCRKIAWNFATSWS